MIGAFLLVGDGNAVGRVLIRYTCQRNKNLKVPWGEGGIVG